MKQFILNYETLRFVSNSSVRITLVYSIVDNVSLHLGKMDQELSKRLSDFQSSSWFKRKYSPFCLEMHCLLSIDFYVSPL